MPMKAIVFDLDGTLLDTLVDLADAANRTLARSGWPTHEHGAYRRFIGDGSRTLITRAMPAAHRTPERIEDVLAQFKADYGRHWKTATRPYPGIPDLLGELTRRRIPQAVVTNKPHPFAERCIHAFFADTPFQIVRGQKEGLPLKPHPSPAFDAAAHMRIPPRDCVLLGDSDVDMATARAAGMLPVGAAWGVRPIDELLQAGAADIIRHPMEILNWFNGSHAA